MSRRAARQQEPTGEGAPELGDFPFSLDMMAPLFDVDENTPYTWAHRGVLPPHDGVCGRSRWWWKSKLLVWWENRETSGTTRGGRPTQRRYRQQAEGEVDSDTSASPSGVV